MVTVIVKFNIKTEYVDELYKEFLALVEYSRKAKGCTQYDFFREIESPNVFVLIETWLSQELINSHIASEYMLIIRKKISTAVAFEPEITMLEKQKKR